MTKLRQIAMGEPNTVTGFALAYDVTEVLPVHTHSRSQLLYAQQGVMQVHVTNASWLVPTTRAIWIPADEPHSIEMRERVDMRTLYVDDVSGIWPTKCRAMEVPHLLRELILQIVRIGTLNLQIPMHSRMVGLLSDLISIDELDSLVLPMPRDPRARSVADRLISNPGQFQTLTELVQDCGASIHTIQRLFGAETGMSLERWRQRARMQHGMVLLHTGATVGEVAHQVGYRSTSAFIAAFRNTFGSTPRMHRACDV